jgi:hypothetical protein
MFFLREATMMLRPWFSNRLPNPKSLIESDVRDLIISFIYEYYIKYNKFVTVTEVWEIFQKHPSIRNNKDYKIYLLLILGTCKAHSQLYLDATHNIIQIEPE